MTFRGLRQFSGLIALAVALGHSGATLAQTTSANQSWTASSQQGTPIGTINPIRTRETHTESNGRTVDWTSTESLGPDGRYVPYSDTQRESVRINDTTSRKVERTYGRNSDGRRILLQEREEETRALAGGEQSVTRTTSNPDANGTMHVVQREVEDSKPLSPGVRVTNTTVLTPDVNGGLSPTMKTEQRETKANDGTVESRKSTLLPDGIGGWKLGEVRESTAKEAGSGVSSKEERVLRPDSNGRLAVVERTLSKQTQAATGEQREDVDTYSTDVPGVAGNDSLQLVQRGTTIRGASSTGVRTTTRRVEQVHPGEANSALQVTQEGIDIVRPGTSGAAQESHVILTTNPDGGLGPVWIGNGKTDNPSAVRVDTAPPTKPH